MTQISATKKNSFMFSLCRLKMSCYYPPVTVDFSPILRPTQTYEAISPVFNNDGNYYTPAFVNPYEQSLRRVSNKDCLKQEKENFFKKVQAYKSQPEQNSPEFNPKDDLYCSICGISFDDYWKHICSSYHSRKVRASEGDKFIRELCEQFSPQDRMANSEIKRKTWVKQKKEKKIAKKKEKSKATQRKQKIKENQLIIKFPKDLFEDRVFNFNLSTNGVTSLNQKL